MPDLFPDLPPAEFIEKIEGLNFATTNISADLSESIIDHVSISERLIATIVPYPFRYSVESDVNVNQTIDFEIVKAPVISTIKVIQTISLNIERSINLTDTLAIKQYIVPLIDNRASGNRGDVFTDPGVIAYQDGLVKPTNVSFTTETTSITLRKPEFGDTNDYQQYRVQRNTLGGDLTIYHDDMWPIYEKFNLSWNYMSNEDATALLIFLQATEGQKMTFINHFGETFQGYIITPFEDIIQPKVNGWSAAFEFQIHEDPNQVNT